MYKLYNLVAAEAITSKSDSLDKFCAISLEVLFIAFVVIFIIFIGNVLSFVKECLLLSIRIKKLESGTGPRLKLDIVKIRKKEEIDENQVATPSVVLSPTISVVSTVGNSVDVTKSLVIQYKTPNGVKTFKTSNYIIKKVTGPTEVFVPSNDLSDYKDGSINDDELVLVKYDYNTDEFDLY